MLPMSASDEAEGAAVPAPSDAAGAAAVPAPSEAARAAVTARSDADPVPASLAAHEGAAPLIVEAIARLGGRDTVLGRIGDLAAAMSTRYTRHRDALAAAGLAYYVTLALAPLALALGSLAGLVLDPADLDAALATLQQRLPDLASTFVPLADGLIQVVDGASTTSFTVTTVVSILVSVYAASRFVFMTRLVLDIAFDVPPDEAGFLGRLVAAVFTLVALGLVVALLITLTFLPQVLSGLGITDVAFTSGVAVVDWVVLLGVTYGFFWALFRFGPHRGVRLSAWSPGAAGAAVWTLVASAGVGVYAGLSRSFGAAVAVLGGAIVLLFWLYLVALGLVLGAELEAVRREARRLAVADGDGADAIRA